MPLPGLPRLEQEFQFLKCLTLKKIINIYMYVCVCVLLKQITLHRYGNGMGERRNSAFNFRTRILFQGSVLLKGRGYFLAKRLPRKNVLFDRPSSRFLSSLSLYRLAKL